MEEIMRQLSSNRRRYPSELEGRQKKAESDQSGPDTPEGLNKRGESLGMQG